MEGTILHHRHRSPEGPGSQQLHTNYARSWDSVQTKTGLEIFCLENGWALSMPVLWGTQSLLNIVSVSSFSGRCGSWLAMLALSSAWSGKCHSSCCSAAGWIPEQLSLGDMGEAECYACECQWWGDDSKCATERETVPGTRMPTFNCIRPFQLPSSFEGPCISWVLRQFQVFLFNHMLGIFIRTAQLLVI